MSKVFLDDIRQPSECLQYMKPRIGDLVSLYKEPWVIVRNYRDFVNTVQDNVGDISHISFDHDLADIHYDPRTWTEKFVYQEETGYDCAKYLKDFYAEKGIDLPVLFVHSMNPVGTQNIIKLFS